VTQALQENNLTLMRLEEFRYRCVSCKKMFSCIEGWTQHKEWMVVCGKTSCICDVFSRGKYSYSLGAANEKYQRAIQTEDLRKLEEIIARVIKRPELIQPEKFKTALETRRDIQRDEILSYINEHSGCKR
jgi:transcriptional regulator NrdR family protein